jgi:hypothetical protein
MVVPDLSGAVFPMSDDSSGVCRVDSAGRTQWHWRYQHCEGTILVSADGRRVWTVIADGRDGLIDGRVSVVLLDSVDGREVSRVVVPDQSLLAEELVAHPDGQHVAVVGARSGEEEDYWSAVYWVRLRPDGGLRLRLYPSDSEVIAGFNRHGTVVAMTDVYAKYVRLRRFDTGTQLLTVRAGSAADLALYTDFLDSTSILASSPTSQNGAEHWLLTTSYADGGPVEDTLGGPCTRPVRYPYVGPDHPSGQLWAPGDGTWFTADSATLYRWTADIG